MLLLYQVFKDCFTGRDNKTYDFMHFIVVFGFIAFVGFELWEVWHSKSFNEEEYARALMWIYSGGGGGLLMKNWTEKTPTNNDG